jgi:methylated-DNA-[protein]-cysteine S-methyltransferase
MIQGGPPALESLCYTTIPSRFGKLGIVWAHDGVQPKICRILLPREGMPLERVLSASYPKGILATFPVIAQVGNSIGEYLEGKPVRFDLDTIALETCPEFQRKVLMADYGIPRGWVSTYGRIAANLGCPAAARAVGNALAHNPFPIIIPCHRVLRFDLQIGGFQGRPGLKRALLELEGLEFSRAGKAITNRVWY